MNAATSVWIQRTKRPCRAPHTQRMPGTGRRAGDRNRQFTSGPRSVLPGVATP